MNTQEPLPWVVAARAVLRCMANTVRLFVRRRTHLPKQRLGTLLRFADGTTARVFRETVVDRGPPEDPCILVVAFRLRLLRGRWHKLFFWECILNTPLFVGFPGFVSKLWLDHDEHDDYRGLYEWNDPESAEHYARSLWRVLQLVCRRDAIRYVVLDGLHRQAVLADPETLEPLDPSGHAWWRVTGSSREPVSP